MLVVVVTKRVAILLYSFGDDNFYNADFSHKLLPF